MAPPRYQPSDYRWAVITGSTGGRTGGDIIPDGFIGVIKHISHAEIDGQNQNVLLRTQPSGINLDARRMPGAAGPSNWPQSWEFDEETVLGFIPGGNVLQVVTSVGAVVSRVVYVVEEGRV